MVDNKKENQYFRVAEETYENIVRRKMPIGEALSAAATNNVTRRKQE